MMIIKGILPCALLSLSYMVVHAQELPEYIVNKIDTELIIDGDMNEEEWTSTDATANFVLLGDDETPPATVTWSKILWDDDFLYVAFFCEDLDIWATFTGHDDQLYLEDAIEVYIDPDGDGLNYIEIELNPLNTIFDLWLDKPWDQGGHGTSSWNMDGLATAVKVMGTIADNGDTDTAWTCEMAMPFQEMSFVAESMNYPPVSDDIWRFNLYRFDREETDDPNAEQTGWSQTGGGQHVPDKFGTIIFAGGSDPSAITENQTSTSGIKLYQNYPNPFSSFTTIRYEIIQPCTITLRIIDIAGRTVFSESKDHSMSGNYSFTIDAVDFAGGMYFYSLQQDSHEKILRKMVVKK